MLNFPFMTPPDDAAVKHARVYGSPGARTRFVGLMRIAWPLLAGALLAGYLIRAAFPVPRLTTTAAGFLLLALVLGVAASMQLMRARFNAFLKGARGEEWAAHQLAFLPETYAVFHGLSAEGGELAGSGDFDHIVLGPGGLFVVETKNWTGDIAVRDGAILYNGKPPDRPPLEQVRRAASRLAELLRARGIDPAPPIRPVLCFAGDPVQPRLAGLTGVRICHSRSLNETILNAGDPPLPASVRAELETALRGMAG